MKKKKEKVEEEKEKILLCEKAQVIGPFEAAAQKGLFDKWNNSGLLK